MVSEDVLVVVSTVQRGSQFLLLNIYQGRQIPILILRYRKCIQCQEYGMTKQKGLLHVIFLHDIAFSKIGL